MGNLVKQRQMKTSKWTWVVRILKWTLIAGVSLAILIVVLYKEEDRRGKRDWENYQHQLQARGETMDWNDYIPPLVRDEQNFFKAPHMQEWFVKAPGSNAYEFKAPFNDQKFAAVISSVNHGPNLIDSAATAKDFLARSDQFEPQLDLIREALKRPFARMDGDYSDFSEMPTPDIADVRLVSQTLAQRARAYLLLGQLQKALDELTLLHNFRRVYEAPPSGKPMYLEAAMLDAAVSTVYKNAVAFGIQSRLWQDPQLATLQKQLEQINLALFMVNALRMERAAFLYYALTPNALDKIDPTADMAKAREFGWFYQNLVTFSTWHQRVIDSIDISNNVVVPKVVIQVDSEENAVGSSRFPVMLSHPYSFVAALARPNLSKAIETFARDQTLVNETQIACALERYRLAHGEYPVALDALVPQFMQTIPHAIIGGQPLHYRRTGDGKFLLYSVGWNERDDGGQPSPRNEKGIIDYTKSDWVWPN